MHRSHLARHRLTALVAATLVALVTAATTVVAMMVTSPRPAHAQAGGTGAGYLHTSGNKIVDSTGATVRLTGINWFGMETDNQTFHGLWADAATWRGQIDQMAAARLQHDPGAVLRRRAASPGAQATSINTTSTPT